MTNYTRKAVKGTGIVFLMLLITSFLAFLWRVLLEGSLTKSDYGLVFAIVAFFQLVLVFRDLGLSSALVKYTAEFKVKKQFGKIKGSIIITFLIQFVIGLFIGGMVIIFSDSIASSVFHGYANTALVSLLIKLYAIAMILVPVAGLVKTCSRGFQKMGYYSLVNFLREFSILFFTFLLLDKGLLVMAPILAYVIYYLVAQFIYPLLFIRKIFPKFFKIKAVLNKNLTKKLFRFGIPVILTGFGGIIFTTTDTIILTLLRPLEEVALYNIGMPTSRILWKLSVALAVVLLPLSSELWASKNVDKIRKGMGILYKYAFMFILPLSIIMFIFPETILRFIFGQDSVGAANVIRILSIGAIARVLGSANNNVLSGMGKPKEVTKITFIGAGVNLLLNFILIYLYGMEGAAAATTFTFILMFFMSMKKLHGFTGLDFPWKDFTKIIIAGGFTAIVIFGVKTLPVPIWIRLSISLIFGSILYLLILLAMGTLQVEEIRKIIRRIIR